MTTRFWLQSGFLSPLPRWLIHLHSADSNKIWNFHGHGCIDPVGAIILGAASLITAQGVENHRTSSLGGSVALTTRFWLQSGFLSPLPRWLIHLHSADSNKIWNFHGHGCIYPIGAIILGAASLIRATTLLPLFCMPSGPDGGRDMTSVNP